MKEEETVNMYAPNPSVSPEEFSKKMRAFRKKHEYAKALEFTCEILDELGYHEGAMIFKALEEEGIHFLTKQITGEEKL